LITARRPAVLVQAAATLVWLIMACRSGESARSESWCPLLSGQVRQRSVHLKTYLSTAASCAGAISGSITSSTRHRRSRRMWYTCTGHPAVPNIRLASTSGIRGEYRTLVRLRQRSCGFHNVVTVCDLQRHGWGCGGHAARSYWWISPPGTLRRRILAVAGPAGAMGVISSQSGGRRFRARAGDAGCSARRTPPGPRAAAVARCSASGR
jgi:hypothetical protein